MIIPLVLKMTQKSWIPNFKAKRVRNYVARNDNAIEIIWNFFLENDVKLIIPQFAEHDFLN